MKFTVNNYRGIKSAELDVDNVAFVAGRNFHGKSSLAQACGLVLTGETMPGKLAKKYVERIIHGFGSNGKTALVSVTNGQGNARIEYPAATFSSVGKNPQASRIAVGFDTVTGFSEKERAGFLSKLLGTAPSKADLLSAVKDANLKADEYENLWLMVERDGWDETHQKTAKMATEQKGIWKHITGGETYGSQKAESWYPANWHEIIGSETRNVEGIKAAIEALETERTTSIRREAVDETRLAELKKIAGDLDNARKGYDEKADDALKLSEKLDALRKTPAPKVPHASDLQACPKCKTILTVDAKGKIIQASDKTPLKADVEAAKAALNKYNGDIEQAETECREAARLRDITESYVNECEKAKLELDRIEADAAKGKPERTADEIQAEIDTLNARVKAITAHTEAYAIHRKVQHYEIIADALAPDGVRKIALEHGLDKLNTALAAHCAMAGWNPVRIDTDLTIWFGNVPYEFCSESEQYRVDATIRLAIAIFDGSDIAIFDRADLLDSPGRNGLMRMITSAGIPAIVCCTKNNAAEVPNMSAHGIATYWVENGELKRLFL